ncbi:MAG: hypothetical protein IPL53_02190 [Ignavibacteria bacterium]|nr:hypothetical protein [Ignavibacteria bacterium]
MKILFIKLLLPALLLFSSCGEKKQPETVVKKDSTENMTIKNDTAVTVKKEMKTTTGKIFTIIETKPSYSVSNFIVTGAGFANSSDTIKFQNENPMTTAMLSDLDKNGFEELYILTKAAGSGSYMDIMAIASFNDKSFGEITVQEIADKDVEKGGMFEGYMGHDSIYISDNKLVREFPVYKSSDANSNPTGGRRKIFYTLKPGEASYQLVITGKEEDVK